MPDVISSISASGSAFPIVGQTLESDAPRAIKSSETDSSAAGQTELDDLLSEFAVHASLAGFVMMRDEMRRQTEMIANRVKEAREESE